MKQYLKIVTVGVAFLLISCHSEPSLQKYYVNHQNEPNFFAMYVSGGIIASKLDTFTKDLQKSFKQIRKVNILALPLNGENRDQYEDERHRVSTILTSGNYKLLMRVDFSGNKVQLRYL